jgi:hypothetical protein
MERQQRRLVAAKIDPTPAEFGPLAERYLAELAVETRDTHMAPFSRFRSLSLPFGAVGESS